MMDFGGMKRIILVTSAFHMPRARMLFERAGIESVPYPTDFDQRPNKSNWLSLIPSADGLDRTSDAVREFIGRGITEPYSHSKPNGIRSAHGIGL